MVPFLFLLYRKNTNRNRRSFVLYFSRIKGRIFFSFGDEDIVFENVNSFFLWMEYIFYWIETHLKHLFCLELLWLTIWEGKRFKKYDHRFNLMFVIFLNVLNVPVSSVSTLRPNRNRKTSLISIAMKCFVTTLRNLYVLYARDLIPLSISAL